MAASQQSLGREIWRAAQLHDALGKHVGVALLVGGMFQEFRGDRPGVDALGHEVVALVAQHANNFSRQRVVEDTDRGLGIATVGRSHRAFHDVLARALAQCLDVGKKRFLAHGDSDKVGCNGKQDPKRTAAYYQLSAYVWLFSCTN